MITPELVTGKEKVSTVECAICRAGGNTDIHIKRLGRHFGVVCRDCLEEFSDRDLELMHNMFTAYGGYFGSLVASKEDSFTWLGGIAESYRKVGNAASCVENDVKTLHQAFLYGIPLCKLVSGLRELLE